MKPYKSLFSEADVADEHETNAGNVPTQPLNIDNTNPDDINNTIAKATQGHFDWEDVQTADLHSKVNKNDCKKTAKGFSCKAQLK